jgi:PAS domain S-box-containing protein
MARLFPSIRLLPRQLRPRLVTSFAAVLAISVLGLSWYQAKQAAEISLLSHEEALLSVARSIARVIADDSTGRTDLVVKHDFRIVLDRPVIDLISIVDHTGHVLNRQTERSADSEPGEIKKSSTGSIEPILVEYRPADILPGLALWQNAYKIETRAPIGNSLRGWVVVRGTLGPAEPLRDHVFCGTLKSGFIILVGCVLVVVLVIRRPLFELEQATEFVSALDREFGKTFPPARSTAELEQLSTAINRTSIRLRDQHTALQTSEARNKALVENLKEVVFRTDPQGRWTYLNPAWSEITGYDVQDSLGAPCVQFIHPEDRFSINELYQSLIERSRDEPIRPIRYLTKHGEVRWIEPQVRPEYAKNGELAGFSGTLNDVTHRHLARHRLRDQLELTQQLLDAIPAPVFYRTVDGLFLGVNRAYCDLFGCEADHYIGKSAQETMPYDSAQSHVIADAQIAATGVGTRYEADVVAVGGMMRNTVCTKAPFYTANGALAGIIGVFSDITEQKRAERQTAQSREFLNCLIDTVPSPLFVKDPAHSFVLVNDAWLRLVDKTREEALGKTDYELFSAEEARIRCQKDDEAFASPSAIEDEESVTDSHGKELNVLTRRSAFTIPGDRRLVVGISSDISEISRAKSRIEDQLRFTNELVEALPFPLYVKDRHGVFVMMNRATETYMGIEREDYIGKTATELQPANADLHHAMELKVLEEKQAVSYTTSTHTRYGSRDTIITKGLFTDYQGEVAGIIGTIHDITERRRIENRLNIQYEIARILAESGSVQEAAQPILRTIGIAMGYNAGTLWEVDEASNSLQCLEVWCTMDLESTSLAALGRMVGSAKGMCLPERVWRNGAPVHEVDLAAHGRLSAPGTSFGIPIKSGVNVTAVMHFSGSRTRDPDADLMAMFEAVGSQIRQFIERQRAERTLRASEAAARKLSLVASHTNNAVIITDTRGRIDWVNRAFTELTGYSAEEAQGKAPAALLQGPDTDPSVVEHMRKKLAAKQGFTAEILNYRKTQEAYWVSIEVQPVMSDTGALTHFIAIEADITERRLGEAALIDATTRLNLAIEGSNLALWDWTMRADHVYLSDTWPTFLGSPRKDGTATLRELRKLVDPDGWRKMRRALVGCLRGQSDAYRVLHRVRGIGGDWRWCQCHGKVVERDAVGTPIRMAGTIADVTEHHNAETALRMSEERYDLAITGANDGVWDLNLIDDTAYLSPQYALLLNIEFGGSGDVLSRWLACTHADDRPTVKQALARHLEYAEPFDTECRMATSAHDYRWFRMRGKAVHDEQRRPLRIVGSISDITDYRLAQEQLQETRDRLESILRSTEHMIWSRSVDSQTLLYINPAVKKIYGRDREDFRRDPTMWLHAVHPEDKARVLSTFSGLLDKESVSIQFRILRPDGSTAWVNERASVARNSAGKPIRIDAITTDVTELQQRESELRYAKEAAEAATQAKSEFLANMSHEIRTPMNGIIGMTDLVLTTELNPEQRDYIEVVRSSSDALLELINDILDFSKIEAGKLAFEVTEFLLRDTLADTIKLLAVRAEEKGLELMWRVNSEVPDVLLGDPMRLRQVVTNLLSNAIKFTSAGEVELCVGVSEPSATNVELLFAVRDTGIGVSNEKTTSIFNPFSQADMSITRNFGGTGLGLAISERLAGMMGGSISLRSTPGVGSTFYFSATFGVGADDISGSSDAHLDLCGLRVLVCDDNSAQLVCLLETLSAWQIQCTGSQDIKGTLATLERAVADDKPYDLAIFDSQLIGSSEAKLLRRIRARSALNDLPLLLLTPVRSSGGRSRARPQRLVTHLTKACSHTEFRHAIAGALGRAVREEMEPSGEVLAIGTGQVRTLRVLLVEDNEINVRFARGVLQKLGHVVTLARNGMEALQAISANHEHPFDLALMDVQMPVMSGLEATGAIRVLESGTGRHLPIIAMTANAMRGDKEACFKAGMDDYLSKPVEVHKLVAAVDRATGSGHAHSGSASSAENKMRLVAVPGAVYDRDTMLETLNDDHAAFKELSEMLFSDHKQMIEAAAQALSAGDPDTLTSVAHNLKGVIGNFAARDASAAAQALYAAAHAGRMEDAAAALERFRQEMLVLEAALRSDPILADA